MLRLVDEGVDEQEICRRFKRGPRFVQQVIDLTRVSRQTHGRSDTQMLRPLERRVLHWREQGAGYDDLAPRFRRSPEFVARVIDLTRVPRQHSPARPPRDALRPLERRVLKWRDGGTTTDDIAARFRRSPRHVEQVERLARYKLAR